MKNRKSISALATALLASLWMAPAWAIPAKPGLLQMAQPDGTVATVSLIGDENFHYYITADGYPLIEDNGYLCYAICDASGTPMSSGVRITEALPGSEKARSIMTSTNLSALQDALKIQGRKAPELMPAKGPGKFSGNFFPSEGSQKALIILVEYQDVRFTLDDPHDYFSRMLNEEGFSDYGGTGSARDYFLQSSSGQFDPQFDVMGPVLLDHKRAYYGGNDFFSKDTRAYEMVTEACAKLDGSVDFSQYDRNNDGYIDNIYVYYAGMGENIGAGADAVWPHSSHIAYLDPATEYVYDGVRLDLYGCSNEWIGDCPDGIGTFCHEFSHVLGLPDIYATHYTGAFSPGSYCAMDLGSYNNNSRTPPYLAAFERYALDWLTPVEISGPANIIIPPISENEAYMIKVGKNEFFLLENRQQEGFDAYIPGHGMLIWHIDYNQSVWDTNVVNDNPDHQYVDIEEADCIQSEETRAGDTFPGTEGITDFSDSTHPSMLSWNGARKNLPLSEIRETPDGLITFKVAGGVEITIENLVPEIMEPSLGDNNTFTLRWAKMEEAQEYELTVSVYGEEVPNETVNGFDGGLKEMPEGWTAECGSTMANAAYCGEATPSLKMTKEDDFIESPRIDEGISGVRFYHRGISSAAGNAIVVCALANGEWTEVASVEIVNDAPGTVSEVEMPEGTVQVRLSCSLPGKGSVAIDDVTLLWGSRPNLVVYPGYDALTVGDTDSYEVAYDDPDAEYFYSVTAIADGLRSRPSPLASVIPSKLTPSGAGSVTAGTGVRVSVIADEITITAEEATPYILCDISGRQIGHGEVAPGSDCILLLQEKGIYLLKAGQKTFKIAY